MQNSITREEVTSLIRYINSTLIVRQLQTVLKSEGQPTSGLKSALQNRLATYIVDIVTENDIQTFERLKLAIYRPECPSPGAQSASNSYSPSPAAQPIKSVASFIRNGVKDDIRIFFKESPFYTILRGLNDYTVCPTMSSNRNTISTVVVLDAERAHQLTRDKSLRCMIYCAALDQMTAFTRDTEIAFPHQVEIRVNEKTISGLNLRGLKNRPGSTRPADITSHLTIKPNYRNEISLTYAMTLKDFVFIVNLVKFESVETLVENLRSGNAIAKEDVITDMIQKNGDSDLVATSTIMSLKCPLSTLRIDLPVRSAFCKHNQCFDAKSFLLLQLQAPTWTCPTCNRTISYKQLVVDGYFSNILDSTPKTVESVTIDADGKWSGDGRAEPSRYPDNTHDGNGDVGFVGQGKHSISLISPPHNGRFPSNAVQNPPCLKRPASEVIDLTLSDDDDDNQPPRPVKRNAAFLTPPSITSSSTSGFTKLSYSP